MSNLGEKAIYQIIVNGDPMVMQLDQIINIAHRDYMKESLRNESNVSKS